MCLAAYQSLCISVCVYMMVCVSAVTHPVFDQEVWCEGPGCVAHHLVHIAAVCDGIVALLLVHHREALEFVCKIVTAHCTHTVTNISLITHTRVNTLRVYRL